MSHYAAENKPIQLAPTSLPDAYFVINTGGQVVIGGRRYGYDEIVNYIPNTKLNHRLKLDAFCKVIKQIQNDSGGFDNNIYKV